MLIALLQCCWVMPALLRTPQFGLLLLVCGSEERYVGWLSRTVPRVPRHR
jgi:hypothetical protein